MLTVRDRVSVSLTTAALLLAGLLARDAHATNGYFAHGYGTHYKGMARAGVALHLNSMASVTNPAASAFVGSRYDIGLALFNPNRGYTVTGGPSGVPGTIALTPGSGESGSRYFRNLHMGANWALGSSGALGLAVYGHIGIKTDFDEPTFGVTRALAGGRELTFSITRAFPNSVEGPNPLELPGVQSIELRMNQWEFELGYLFGLR